MADVTIRNLDDDLVARLRVRAALHGCSMEEEACRILGSALSTSQGADTGAGLVSSIREWVEQFGGVELELPERGPMREPPDFSGPEYGE